MYLVTLVEGIVTGAEKPLTEPTIETEELQMDKGKDDDDDHVYSQFETIEGFPLDPSFEFPLLLFADHEQNFLSLLSPELIANCSVDFFLFRKE